MASRSNLLRARRKRNEANCLRDMRRRVPGAPANRATSEGSLEAVKHKVEGGCLPCQPDQQPMSCSHSTLQSLSNIQTNVGKCTSSVLACAA